MNSESKEKNAEQAVGSVRLCTSAIMKSNDKFPSVQSIEFGLHKLNGTLSIHVDRLSDSIELRYDLSICPADAMLKNLRLLNFSFENNSIVEMIPSVHTSSDDVHTHSGKNLELMFSIRGMSCSNCAVKVEKHLLKQPQVRTASVSSMTNKAKVELTALEALEEGGELLDQALEEVARELERQVRSLGYDCDWIAPLTHSSSSQQSREIVF